MSLATAPPRTDTPFARLDREWATLYARRRHRSTARRWAAREPALADVDDLGQLITDDVEARRVYAAAVLRLVRAGDELAGRALLQLLVPGLARLASDLSCDLATSRRRQELESDVISVAWMQIAAIASGASAARQPKMILRNVRRETLRLHRRLMDEPCDVRRRPRSGPKTGPRVVPLDPSSWGVVACGTNGRRSAWSPGRPGPRPRWALAHTSDTPPSDIARITLHAAVCDGVISSTAAELVWQVAVNDQPAGRAGAALGMARSTAYKARDDALGSLRTHLAAS